MRLLTRNEVFTLLKKDHQTVKALFDRFEDSQDQREKKDIAVEAIAALKVHAQVEEELFYPAVRKQLDDDFLVNEADEEHHAAKVLIAELELMRGNEPNYEAKFMVLAENVRHHIKEEEGELFPKAARTDIDFEALGRLMEGRREVLEREGVPGGAEEAMVKAAGLPEESPSMRFMKTAEVPIAERKRTRRHGGRRKS